MDTIFFILSKVVQFCIEPLNWVLVFVSIGLLFLGLRKVDLCRRFLVLALLDLLIVGWLPSSELFLRVLEDAYPKTNLSQISEQEIGGIIILGGAIGSGEISHDRGEIAINSSGERLTKAFELIRKYPNVPYIFSGYSGRLFPRGISEADAFKQLIQEQGLSETKGYYENQSRNTYENMLFMKPMVEKLGLRDSDGKLKPWLLITSASHMYRSVKIAQKQEIAVIPILVDFQTANRLKWTSFDLEDGVQNWNKLVHELIGIVAYWLTGKI
jgi:uncharacterized SAM-binding protein YcdF (DUF218 family)